MADKLTVTGKFNSVGADALIRDTRDVGKHFKQLSDTVKITKTALDELRKIAANTGAGFKDQVRDLRDLTAAFNTTTTQVTNLANAYNNLTQTAARANAQMGGGVGGPGGPGQGGGPGGAFGGYGQRGGGQSGGGGLGTIDAVQVISKIGGALAGAAASYYSFESRSAALDTRIPLMGLESAAGTQSYRNFIYQQAQTSPVGYLAFKRSQDVQVRGKGGMRISRPDDAADMSAEQRRLEAEGSRNTALMAGGALTAIGSIAGLAGAAGGAATATGIGATVGLPLLAAAGLLGGVSMFGSAYLSQKELTNKVASGAMNVTQSERMIKDEQLRDQMFAIERRQMATVSEMAPSIAAMNRYSLGFGEAALGGFGGYGAGEVNQVVGDITRHFGGRARSSYRAVLKAGLSGMDLGVGTEIAGTGAVAYGDGNRALERVFAAGIRQGMKDLDIGFFEKLGTAVAQNTYGSQGKRAVESGAIFFTGLGPKASPHEIAASANVLATEARLNQLPHRQAINMVAAMQTVGGKGSMALAGSLAEASITDLFGAGSKRLQNLGATPDMLIAQISSRINTAQQEMGGDQRARDIIQKYGAGNMEAALQKIRQQKASKDKGERSAATKDFDYLTSVFGYTMGLNEEDSAAMMRALSTSKEEREAFAKGRGWLGGRGGSTAGAITDIQKRRKKEEYEGGMALVTDRTTAMQSLNEVIKGLEKSHEWIESGARGQKAHQLHGEAKRLREQIQSGGEVSKGTLATANEMINRYESFMGLGASGDTAGKLAENLGIVADAFERLARALTPPVVKKIGAVVNQRD